MDTWRGSCDIRTFVHTTVAGPAGDGRSCRKFGWTSLKRTTGSQPHVQLPVNLCPVAVFDRPVMTNDPGSRFVATVARPEIAGITISSPPSITPALPAFPFGSTTRYRLFVGGSVASFQWVRPK